MALEILTLTMKSLYSLDPKRGVCIISVFLKYAVLAPMLHEIWAIYSFTQNFLTSTSVEQTTNLVNDIMAFYGILKTL
ncbi:hypothetical protein GGX14DRAFT_580530 [Mycena pura]|uniref:Uncharacterized protein n=1 Tax=Mycena pura TaxID=153505 RepID=A0AAD6XXK3_9AGAR|nr:hypothetical protein GGX14DRAFT_580530 [Mycena pura]